MVTLFEMALVMQTVMKWGEKAITAREVDSVLHGKLQEWHKEKSGTGNPQQLVNEERNN